jgi:hypothetical protein
MMAPGTRALAFASRWFAPAIVHRTFEPLIADWQREWYESPPRRRRWVSVRASVAFICAAAISSPMMIATPIPRAIARQVLWRIAAFCLVVGAVVSIPLVRSMGLRELDAPLWAAVLLMAMPAAVTMAFPFAMIVAVDAIRRSDVAPHVERAAALKLVAFAVCFLLVSAGVVVPFANQEWLEVATPPGWNVPQPGWQQLSTFELLNHPERSDVIVPGSYTRAGEIRRVLINRGVHAVMPAMLVWLRWTALSRVRRRRFWPLPASAMTVAVLITLSATVFSGSHLEYQLAMQPGSGQFVPLIVFGMWAIVEQRLVVRERAAA